MLTQQQLQQKLQMLKPNYQQRFIKEQKEFFDSEKYVGNISEELSRYRQFAMMHESEIVLNISFKYWKYIAFGTNKEFVLNDIITFLRACETRTFKEWLTTYPYTKESTTTAVADWEEYRTYVGKINATVNPIIDQFTTELLDKLLRLQHLEVSGQSNSIPLPHKR